MGEPKELGDVWEQETLARIRLDQQCRHRAARRPSVRVVVVIVAGGRDDGVGAESIDGRRHPERQHAVNIEQQ